MRDKVASLLVKMFKLYTGDDNLNEIKWGQPCETDKTEENCGNYSRRYCILPSALSLSIRRPQPCAQPGGRSNHTWVSPPRYNPLS